LKEEKEEKKDDEGRQTGRERETRMNSELKKTRMRIPGLH
jgi:hypothetical protein